ncbi:MAG: hypothetical protein FWC17_04640 [Treponema sp.]|nr:hypothetical protein [Treponema sp.]
MNKDLFLQQVQNNCECDQKLLDMAVRKGFYRARNDRFDSKKLLKLAAACVFSFSIFISLNLEPFKAMADGYYRNWNKAQPGCSELLAGYINSITGNIKNHSGGE